MDLFETVDSHLADALLAPDPVLDGVLAANAAAGLPAIDVSPLQGKLLHLLARAMGARRIIEVSWNPSPGKTMRATFSVERLGLREAMRQARATRWEKEIEIYGAPLGGRRGT